MEVTHSYSLILNPPCGKEQISNLQLDFKRDSPKAITILFIRYLSLNWRRYVVFAKNVVPRLILEYTIGVCFNMS